MTCSSASRARSSHERVTRRNIRQILEGLIERAKPYVKWMSEAVDEAVKMITDLLTMIGDADKGNQPGKGNQPQAVFGHKRELVRIVDLANSYVRSLEWRGLQCRKPLQVEPEDIEAVWKMSFVKSPPHWREPSPSDRGALMSTLRKVGDSISILVSPDRRRRNNGSAWNCLTRFSVNSPIALT